MGERVYVVTGAGGFVGSALCRRLLPLGRVRALVRRPVSGPWHESAVVDLAREAPAPAALAGAEAVFHLAGRAHAVDEDAGAEALHRAVTVDGTRRLLEACARAGVRRVVFASSVKAMGEGGAEVIDGSAAGEPLTAYGKSKRAAEEIVLRGGYVGHATALRLPLVYGPGQRGNLARMIDAVDRGRFPPPPRVANRRSMIHVDDVARAALLASERPAAAGRALVVSDGRAYATREIYEWICEALAVSPPRWTVPRACFRALALAGDAVRGVRGRRWWFDSDAYDKLLGSAHYDTTAAHDALGFAPEWDLRRALPEMVRYSRQARAAAQGR